MDVKTTPPPSITVATTQSRSPRTTPPATPTTPTSALSDVQKQTFQHIFEKLVNNNSNNSNNSNKNSNNNVKLAPKQFEKIRSLLENVRDSKHLQLIVDKFKSNLEQTDIVQLLPNGNGTSTAVKSPATATGNERKPATRKKSSIIN